MRTAYCLLLSVAMTAQSGVAATFRLRHNYRPGTELTYSFKGTLTQSISSAGRDLLYELALESDIQRFTVDYSRWAGVALIGQLGKNRWERREGRDRTVVLSGEQVWTSACFKSSSAS